jgi:acyl-CoA thioesterase-2
VEHQQVCPDVPPPESLPDSLPLPPEQLEQMPEKIRRFYERFRPFEFRLVNPVDWLHPEPAPAQQQMWFRTVDRLPADEALHRSLLAYVSDYNLLNTATRPHALSYFRGNVVLASIDHAMWFHRPMRVDDWLLYVIDSPSASGARGFSRGSIFSRAGRLVASTAQEGLMRPVSEPSRDS